MDVTIPQSTIDDPEWLKEKFSRPMAWIDLQLLAEDGQVSVSYRDLAARWKWSVNKVIRFIDELVSDCSVERSDGTFHGTKTRQLITVLSDSYNRSRNNNGTFRGTFQKSSPSSPSIPSPDVPPTPPSLSLSYTPPISPSENSTHSHCASAYAREGQPHPPTPFPNPFMLSSMERTWCMGDPEKVVDCKRRHLAENLKIIAGDFGMDEAEQKKFLDYYCSPSVRNASEIRAEGDPYFNLRQKAEGWMEKRKSDKSKPASRIEQFADTAKRFDKLMDELYGSDNARTTGSPGYYPDEQ